MRKNTHQDVTASLEEKTGIEAAIEAAKAEYQALVDEIGGMSRTIDTAERTLTEKRTFYEQTKGQTQRDYNPDSEPAVQELREDLATKRAAWRAAKNRNAEINQRIRQLQNRLQERVSVSTESVIQHQEAIAAASEKVGRLRSLIDEQKSVIHDINAYQSPLPALEARREDLLAGLAVGEATEDDLQALDKDIDQASTKEAGFVAGAESKIDTAQQTINGLSSRLSAAETELRRLQDLSPGVVEHLLRSEAEQVGMDYARYAAKLIEAYTRLVGLHRLLTQGNKGQQGLAGLGAEEFCIPRFRLSALDGVAGESDGRRLFYAGYPNRWGKLGAEAADSEIQRLKEAGVQLL